MIVTCREMREIEERAFSRGITAERLMDEAGGRIAATVHQFFPVSGECLVFFGKGHNGGDALVAARRLAETGWAVRLHPVFAEDELAPLTRKKLAELEPALEVASEGNGTPYVVLDGLLGIGGKPGLREPILAAAVEINRLRREHGASVFALDLPTGLDGDTGEAAPGTVEADFTLSIGFAKRGLLADQALDFVGRLAVLPLSELTLEGVPSLETVATPCSLGSPLPPRRFSSHKGDCGRVGIIAGSLGLTGAAVMTAGATVRAGAGLVSLFVTPDAYPVIAASSPPEVMTSPVAEYRAVLHHSLDVLAIGPGLGSNARHQDADDLLQLIKTFAGPMVIDADALNLLAAQGEAGRELLRRRAGPRLLTPHPGEMRRLFPEAESLTRRETVERFLAGFHSQESQSPPLVLLLKGSRTIIGEVTPEGCRLSYNTTGSPGMASGGMGDLLTGVCAALAGQRLSLFDAARVGAWICGRSAELAVAQGWRSVESLCATDLPEFFGTAFNELRGRAAV